MTSKNPKQIAAAMNAEGVKYGDIKKLAREIKIDHELALALWSTGDYRPRMLATLIFDKNLLNQEVIDGLAADMLDHEKDERNQLADWLLANQLTKNKKLAALIENWEDSPSLMLRRLFWYRQARLRWTGQTPPDNSEVLLEAIEQDITGEQPEVQWAMNFCAGWIGVYEPKLRARCVRIGKDTGLYSDEKVVKNCTPNYLPEFIRIEVAKRQ